jgi:hypothetical protein
MPVAGGNIAVRDYRTAAVPRPFRASTGSGTSGADPPAAGFEVSLAACVAAPV